jgi:GAF domain-containing protein
MDALQLLQGLAYLAAQAIVNARLLDDNLRQLERLTALNTTAWQMTQTNGFEALLEQVVHTCVEAFQVGLAWLGRAEPNGQLTPLAVYGKAADLLASHTLRWDEAPEGQGPLGRAIRSGFPISIPDLANDSNVVPWRAAALRQGFRSELALPLIARGRPFGALLLQSDRLNYFSLDRIGFFMTYANQVASALENARLFAETERRLQTLRSLRAIDTAIISSTDLSYTLNTILSETMSQLSIDAADIFLFNSKSQTLEFAAGRGFRTGALRDTRLRLGEGHAGQAALERRIVTVPDPADRRSELAPSITLGSEDFRTYHGVPLIAKGVVNGVLELFHRSERPLSDEWMQLLEALAGQTAIAIDNASLFESLQRSNQDLGLAYDATIEGWSHALDLRDKETEGHSLRVTEMTFAWPAPLA